MAVDRELFSILQVGASGEGSAPTKKVEGDAVSAAIEVPVLAAKDLAGNFQHVPIRASGDAQDAFNVPVLDKVDLAGNVVAADARAAGQAPGSNATEAMVAIDLAGNLQYLKVDSTGELIVTSDGGARKDANAEVTSTPSSFVDVVTLTVLTSKKYRQISTSGYCSFQTSWRLIFSDNAVETVIARGQSGPGSFGFIYNQMNLERSTGATGVQKFILRGRQEHGSAQDIVGNITCIEM